VVGGQLKAKTTRRLSFTDHRPLIILTKAVGREHYLGSLFLPDALQILN
jgi:hypothetical protein